MELIKQDNQYDYYVSKSDHFDRLIEEEKKPFKGTLGKYLIFSSNVQDLLLIAGWIVEKFNLSCIRISNQPRNNGEFSYVASIYDYEDRYSKEINVYLTMYSYNKFCKYRYWKEQFKSDQGFYSIQYLNSIKT